MASHLLRIVATLALGCAACSPAAAPSGGQAASAPGAGASRTGAPAPEGPAIAQVHARQCGRCHTRPEPGTRSRAELVDALSRHHKRVHLSDAEWQAMIDYLAPGA